MKLFFFAFFLLPFLGVAQDISYNDDGTVKVKNLEFTAKTSKAYVELEELQNTHYGKGHVKIGKRASDFQDHGYNYSWNDFLGFCQKYNIEKGLIIYKQSVKEGYAYYHEWDGTPKTSLKHYKRILRTVAARDSLIAQYQGAFDQYLEEITPEYVISIPASCNIKAPKTTPKPKKDVYRLHVDIDKNDILSVQGSLNGTTIATDKFYVKKDDLNWTAYETVENKLVAKGAISFDFNGKPLKLEFFVWYGNGEVRLHYTACYVSHPTFGETTLHRGDLSNAQRIQLCEQGNQALCTHYGQ